MTDDIKGNNKQAVETDAENIALLLQIDDLQTELDETRLKMNGVKEEFLRRAADLDNSRKRMSRERLEVQERAAQRIIKALLPALNDLTRAIDMADADEAVPQHHVDAIKIMDKKIFDILGNEGLTAIGAKPGDEFDPEFHEAILALCEPEVEPGKIIQVIEGGFTFKDRLLIPAKVTVCIEPKEKAEE